MTQRAGAPRGFRQPRCNACGLTPALCLCGAWPALEVPFEISVVMPRSEARAASNSARLLPLWLERSVCHVRGEGGESGLRDASELLARPSSALLFPGGNTPAPVPPGVRHLIVPDGTWSQALRIERRWFATATLPRLVLDAGWPSVYGLRRTGLGRRAGPPLASAARSPLCTFEAIAIAIGVLGEPELACALLARFAEWARRARWLKSGGPAANAPRLPPPGDDLPEHPAAARWLAPRSAP